MKKKNCLKLSICSALLCFLSSLLFFSCSESKVSGIVNSEKLFTLKYGDFDDQLNLFNLASIGSINTYIAMRDGFFYIANGESKKIMEMNSYGDLLTLFYNEDSGVHPDFVLSENAVNSTRKAIAYPFNDLGPIAVDSRKCVYVVDALPDEQQISNEDENLLFRQVVLRFGSDGKALDYIGQQGVGGTPFPFIKNIYTTKNDELVVICVTNAGLRAYWFNDDGSLLYVVPIKSTELPNPFTEKTDADFYMNCDGVVPSYKGHVLYVKIDYFNTYVDQTSKVQSGIDYAHTLLYPLEVSSGTYGEPFKIPPYEEIVSEGFGKITYTMPYDFLGITDTGWMFFSIPVEDGYMLQMVQPDGQRILKRKIKLDNSKILYYTFALSEKGLLSGLFAYSSNASLEWWRLDSLIDNLTED